MFGQDVLDLSLDAFVAWLGDHEREFVGLLGSWLCSPLVFWLSDLCGCSCWIDHQFFGPLGASQQILLPDWARLFLAQTERYGGFSGVTGIELFDLLAGIESRSSCCLFW